MNSGGADEGLGEGFGAEQDHGRGEHEQPGYQQPPGAARQVADPGGRPDQVRLGRLGPGGLPQVEDEEAEQGEAEDQADLPGQRDQERHDRGDEQEPQLGPVPGLQHQLTDAAPGPPGRHPERDDHHQRPAQAQQQPVGPGHVGRCVLHVVRIVPGGVGEVQVHRVLGQDRDDGQQGDRQRPRDVDPGRFGPPGQQERGSHHGHAERRQADRGGRMHAAQAQEQGRDGERGTEPDGPCQLRGHDHPPDGHAARTEGPGHPGQATSWPKVSPTLGRVLPPEGRGALSVSTTGCRTTPLQTSSILANILLIAQLTISL